MKTKNVIVIGIWIFVIVWLIGMFIIDGDFFFAMILFFIAWTLSVVVLILERKEPEIELSNEIQDIKSKLGALTREVEEIKKIIEEEDGERLNQ